MTSRDEILARVRAKRPQLDRPLPDVPLFDDHPPASLLAAFKDSLHCMGGLSLDTPTAGDPLTPVRDKLADAKVVCSTVPEIAGNRDLAAVRTAHDLADVDFGVVRASFGVAETGSVLLSESDLGVNALAYLAQHLIVLLDPEDIVLNLHHAYRRPEFHTHRYASFNTGPSATADIEGVLIHGAQGVRSLSVLPLARQPAAERRSKSPSGGHETSAKSGEKRNRQRHTVEADPIPAPTKNADTTAVCGTIPSGRGLPAGLRVW